MSLIKYKGYAAKVEFSPEDELLVGHVIGIKDRLSFHSETANGVEKAFHNTIDDYISACQKRGVKPSKPYSGEFRYRPGQQRHEQLALIAALENASNNDLVNKAVDAYIQGKLPAA